MKPATYFNLHSRPCIARKAFPVLAMSIRSPRPITNNCQHFSTFTHSILHELQRDPIETVEYFRDFTEQVKKMDYKLSIIQGSINSLIVQQIRSSELVMRYGEPSAKGCIIHSILQIAELLTGNEDMKINKGPAELIETIANWIIENDLVAKWWLRLLVELGEKGLNVDGLELGIYCKSDQPILPIGSIPIGYISMLRSKAFEKSSRLTLTERHLLFKHLDRLEFPSLTDPEGAAIMIMISEFSDTCLNSPTFLNLDCQGRIERLRSNGSNVIRIELAAIAPHYTGLATISSELTVALKVLEFAQIALGRAKLVDIDECQLVGRIFVPKSRNMPINQRTQEIASRKGVEMHLHYV